MRTTRIFVEDTLSAGAQIKLPAAAAGHVSRVLRLTAGDQITLFDGRGGEYTATLLEVRGASVTARIDHHDPIERESPLDLTLIQSIARGDRMDWLVQKATELGVTRIQPVFTERTVVRLDPDQARRRTEHWRNIAIAACEQCGRNRIPQIATPMPLLDCLENLPEHSPFSRLLLDPQANLTADDLPPLQSATLLIGPEGGLTDPEREFATRQGFKGLRCGPRILRTETAGLAAITLLQGQFGDFASAPKQTT